MDQTYGASPAPSAPPLPQLGPMIPISSSSSSSSLQSSSSSAPVLSTKPQPSAPPLSQLAPMIPVFPSSSSSSSSSITSLPLQPPHLAFFNPNSQLPVSNGNVISQNRVSDADRVSEGINHLEKGEYMDALCCFQIVAKRELISSDVVEAYYWLADMYRFGTNGVDSNGLSISIIQKNDELAFYYYKLAADQGHPGAQCDLAGMYRSRTNGVDSNGSSIQKNYDVALHYYKLAADQGLPDARGRLKYLREKSAALESSVAPISSSSSSSSLTPPTSPQPSAPPLPQFGPMIPISSSSSSSASPSIASLPLQPPHLAFFNPNPQLPVSNGNVILHNSVSDADRVSEGINHLEKGEYMDALCCFQIVAKRELISSDVVEAYYQLARLREIVENRSLAVLKMYPPEQTAKYWYTRAATNGHLGALRVLLEPQLQDYINQNGSFFRAMLNKDERNAAQHLINKLNGLDSERMFGRGVINILLSGDLGKIVNKFPWVVKKVASGWEPDNLAVSSSSMNGNRH